MVSDGAGMYGGNMKYILLKIMHPLLAVLMRSQRKHRLQILNDAPHFDGNAIYVVNHSNKYDMPMASEVIKEHTFVLVGRQQLNLADWVCFRLNGVIYVDRKDRASRQNAKEAVQCRIQEGQNVCLFPEGTWNLSPSKPMLPLYWGVIDIARVTGRPIVPIVLEYRGHARWGSIMYVSDTDSKQDKIEELSDNMATMKWKIWEMFPVIFRAEICEDEWDQEVRRRLADYPKLDYTDEQSCVRKR